ncbi:hypothetical protein KNP414_03167 [Paenibacillus mucilaginosus KNP414]|uniref:Uncharacterized protein n=1 Tax=Paenibacillus mucilaginosus (strain KNP414) TaxID=1036673 RepID=F8FD65_PAEMK|nr:hypothetical protein KNP414_03167 [Paenibacillus mucilaginosus KNP414]
MKVSLWMSAYGSILPGTQYIPYNQVPFLPGEALDDAN